MWAMRYPNFLPILLLSSFGSMGQPADSPAAKGSAADEAGIQQVLAEFVDAWNLHDPNAFSMVFAEDADFTNVRGMSAHGRTNIDSFHAPVFRTWFKDSYQKITHSTIRFIGPGVAAVDAWWEMTGSTNPSGQPIPLRKGLLNFVMTRSSGKWVITVMHNMELAMAPLK
jgi:uncharacterized protein (TIGR02246 family)